VAAAALASASLGVAAAPPCSVLACDCDVPAIAELVRYPTVALFVGTAEPRVGDHVPVRVEGWFRGPGAAPLVLTTTGQETDATTGHVMMNTCGMALAPGRWIVAATRDSTFQRFMPGICLPAAPLDTPQGQAFMAEAVAAFGAPQAPPPAATERPAETSGRGAATSQGPLIAIAAAALAGTIVLFGLLAILARRRTSPP
jgi:hypothetical protein